MSGRWTRWARPAVAVMLAALVVVVGLFGVSVYGAATRPGNEGVQAKWADWMRDHHAQRLVNWMERSYYARHAPPVGGRPAALAVVAPPHRAPRAPAVAVRTARPRPADVAPIVAGLAGEGVWRPTGALVGDRPAMYVTQVRPDRIHTSVLTSLVWMDPAAYRFRLVAGSTEPGGLWHQPSYVTPAERTDLVAAFNGGFRFKDAHGGFYAEGRAAVPLVDRAASFVVDGNGGATVGQWGRDDALSPSTASVLQNLVLLVDGGRPVPGIDSGDPARWGQTIGNRALVWRSGIGETADGALVYAGGPGLSAASLADVLARGGAVRAMSLDINPNWVTFNFYDHPVPSRPAIVVGRKLLASMQRPADRYLSTESRDFIAVSTR